MILKHLTGLTTCLNKRLYMVVKNLRKIKENHYNPV